MSWEMLYSDEIIEPCMTLGVFGQGRTRSTGPSAVYKPYMERMVDYIAEDANADVIWSDNIHELDRLCDVILVPEFFNKPLYDYLKADYRIETPTIAYIINSKPGLTGTLKQMDRRCSVIWNSANNIKIFNRPAFWTPCATYEIAEMPEKIKPVLIQQGRHHKDKLRAKAMHDLLHLWQGDQIDFSSRDTDEQLHEVGLFGHPKLNYLGTLENMDGFADYEVIIECASTWQQNQNEYWSDRQPISASHGTFIVTNFKPTLENWESAISHEDFVAGNYTLDHEALKRDVEKWSMKNRIIPIWRETAKLLNLPCAEE